MANSVFTEGYIDFLHEYVGTIKGEVKLSRSQKMSVLRKYIQVLKFYLADSRKAELMAINELRKFKGLEPLKTYEYPEDEWIFSGGTTNDQEQD